MFLKWAFGGGEYENGADPKLSCHWLSVVKIPFFLDFGDVYTEAIQEQHFHSSDYFLYLKIKEKLRWLFARTLWLLMEALSVPFGPLTKKTFASSPLWRIVWKKTFFLHPSVLASLPILSFLIYSLFLVIKPFCLAKWIYILCYLIYFATS